MKNFRGKRKICFPGKNGNVRVYLGVKMSINLSVDCCESDQKARILVRFRRPIYVLRKVGLLVMFVDKSLIFLELSRSKCILLGINVVFYDIEVHLL